MSFLRGKQEQIKCILGGKYGGVQHVLFININSLAGAFLLKSDLKEKILTGLPRNSIKFPCLMRGSNLISW